MHLTSADQLTEWLRAAISRGNVSDVPTGSGFPRYVWAHREGMWFEARLANDGQGEYKGYPLAEHEAPRGATR